MTIPFARWNRKYFSHVCQSNYKNQLPLTILLDNLSILLLSLSLQSLLTPFLHTRESYLHHPETLRVLFKEPYKSFCNRAFIVSSCAAANELFSFKCHAFPVFLSLSCRMFSELAQTETLFAISTTLPRMKWAVI